MEFRLEETDRGWIAIERGDTEVVPLCQDMDHEGEIYYFENLVLLISLLQEWMWSIGEKELKVTFKVGA